MVKYLSAEIYKVIHRRNYTFGALAVILGLIAAFFALLKGVGGPGATFEFFVSVLCLLFSMGLYFSLLGCDIVFSDQYKNNTLKNEVSFGLPRARIYLGKLICAILLSVVFCAVIIAVYLALARLLFPAGMEIFTDSAAGTVYQPVEGVTEQALKTLGQSLCMAFPLWLGGLGLFQMLLFILRGSTSATVIYVLLVGGLNSGLRLMDMVLPKLHDVVSFLQLLLLQTPFDRMSQGIDLPHAWAVGLGWFAVSTAIGLITFQKREIN